MTTTATTATTVFTREQAKAADAELNEALYAQARAQSILSARWGAVHRAADDDYRRRYDSRSGWKLSDEEAFAKATEVGREIPGYDGNYAIEALTDLAKAQDGFDAAEQGVADADKWADHGKWARYGVVPGGHIHTQRGCFTLRWDTTFLWAYQVSGDTVADAIEVYGEALCSHCFPDAPVAQTMGKIAVSTDGHPMTKAEAQAVKDAKAAEKAAKLAKKTADQVVDVETGKVLYKTERGATNDVASTLDSAIWYGSSHPSYTKWIALLDQVSAALGAKQNRPAAEVRAELVAKAEKKAKAKLGGKKCGW